MAVLTEGTDRKKGTMIYKMDKAKLQNWIDHQGGETYIIEDDGVALIISNGDVAILEGHEEVVRDGIEMYADRHMSEVKHVHP